MRFFFFLYLLLYSQPCFANISLDIPNDTFFSSNILQIILLITLLGLAPSLLITMTSFTRVIIVLSILRTAFGLQQTPPNIVIVSLSLFLTMFIMMPTLVISYENGVLPLLNKEISEKDAIIKIAEPFHKFMLQQTKEKDLETFAKIIDFKKLNSPENIPFRLLIPTFMLGEIKKAFEMGFLVFLPFLIIDLLVASILMSLGMMMLPPASISLPFKIIFFVLIDGWNIIIESLTKSFNLY